MKIIEAFLDALFPNKCVGCDRIIPKGDSLCDFCFEDIPITANDNRCRVCGCKKKECQCRFHAFHFTSVTAPFYNEDIARRVMYAFKFNRHLEFAEFFAKSMALSVKTDFYGVDFNAVVFVPMLLKNELRRGYNQSYELAARISKILNVPLVENALGCNKKRLIQHKTDFKKRFENVKGVYYPNLSLKGRTVLLVDDIKTSGATLDECAKALLKAGANEVYCVTGLIIKRK
ncbi:MAG: ComF family protein [Clostridia bacterium]|nr:ComF family protein [Clostridia bacterium]